MMTCIGGGGHPAAALLLLLGIYSVMYCHPCVVSTPPCWQSTWLLLRLSVLLVLFYFLLPFLLLLL
jgi:hypothetical protein